MAVKHRTATPIYRTISQRYLLAVLIIALLSTAAYITLQSARSDSDSTAYIVNLSGRQRMLSQHIALDAHRLFNAMSRNEQYPEALLAAMNNNIKDMKQANHQLSSGLLTDHRVVALSTPIREMYFSEMNLHNRVEQYLEAANKLMLSTHPPEALSYIHFINKHSEPLLKDLDAVVNQYQLEGEARLDNTEKLEFFVWLATLIALSLEVIFIFRPMASLVVSTQDSQRKTLENLEEIVESRTLKLELANQKLKKIATHDPLTTLRNRLTLESDVEAWIQACKQHHIPFALCIIDLDWFKKINDHHGHLAGDFVLQELAQLLKEGTREYDYLYRVGGEEFVLALNRINCKEAMSKIEALRVSIEEHDFNYKDHHISLTISGGLYHSDLFTLTKVHDVIGAADRALYSAKKSGRNCIRYAQSTDFDEPATDPLGQENASHTTSTSHSNG